MSVAGVEVAQDAVLSLAAAPAYRPGTGQDRTALVGVVVFARPLDAERLRAAADPGSYAIAASASDGAPVTFSDDAVRDVAPGPDALRAVRGDTRRVWTGEVRTFEGDRYLAAAVPLSGADGRVPALLLLVSPGEVLEAAALSASRALFAAVLAAALLSIIIAMWLGSRIARPVVRLTETARRVEEGDLEARPDPPGPGEIGMLAGAFGSMTSSLQETIAAEQAVRRQTEAIVAGMGEGLVAMDPDFVVQTFNRAAEEITGVRAADAVGRLCYEVYGHATAASNGKPICESICPLRHDGGRDGSVSLVREDGARVGLSVTCSPLRDDEGNLIGGVDLLSDVTAQREAEEMKTNILSNISHEIRTPLTPIRGYTEMLRRREVPRETAMRFLDEISESTRKLERIVDVLVEVAAMQSGRTKVTPGAVGASDLVRQAVDRWTERPESGGRVRAAGAARLPRVMADRVLVDRVLDELIDNALKFSPDGGEVVVRARAVDGGALISVSDHGIGIEPEDAGRVSETFVQGDPSATRRFGGLGVGLSLVRSILEGHGSELRIDSAPGEGSTFSFLLRKAAASPRSDRAGGRARTSSKRRR